MLHDAVEVQRREMLSRLSERYASATSSADSASRTATTT